MKFDLIDGEVAETTIDDAVKRLRNASQALHHDALGVSARYWSAAKDESGRLGEFFRYMVRIKRRAHGVTIEWMKAVPCRLEGRRKVFFVAVTRGRSTKYPRARFVGAKAWELDLIMQAEEDFGAIRLISKMLSDAGKRLTFIRNAISREGMVSSKRLNDVVKQTQKACEVAAVKAKKENLDIGEKSVDLTQDEGFAQCAPTRRRDTDRS